MCRRRSELGAVEPSKRDGVRMAAAGLAALLVVAGPLSGGAGSGSPPAAETAPVEDLRRKLDAFIAPLVADGFLSGNLLVSRGDEVIYRASYGLADIEHGVPNGPETRFCVASLSKPMTAVAAVRLVERERLGLDDPVSRWIEDFPSGDAMTVEDVLTHRAGIPHRVTLPIEESRPMTSAEIVARVRAKGLLYEPGAERTYSSAGYAVLAHIIERATGTDYDSAMRELVFAPLGMDATAHVDARGIVPRRAAPYRAGPEGLINATLKDMSFLVGGGSLVSTIDDVHRFARAYLDRELLTARGWEIFDDRLGWDRGDVTRWSGASNGFGAFLDIHEASRLTVAFTGNAGLGALQELRRGVPAIVLGEDPAPARRIPRAVELPESTLRDYEGTYTRDDGVTIDVVLSDGFLYSNDGVIHPLREDWFFSRGYYTEVEFTRGDDGRIREMVLHIEGLGTRVYQRAG